MRPPPIVFWLAVATATVISLIPRALYLQHEIMDPFLSWNVAYVQRTLPTGHILPLPSCEVYRDVEFHPSLEAMIATLSLVLGISPYDVRLLPIGGLLLPFLVFVVARRLTRSPWISLAL